MTPTAHNPRALLAASHRPAHLQPPQADESEEGVWLTEQMATEAFAAWAAEFREQRAGFLTARRFMALLRRGK